MSQPLAQPIWITGAAGLIGHWLVNTAPKNLNSAVRGLTRSHLDLTDSSAVRACFSADQPRLVIHCAALTRSPECQTNPTLATRLNVEVTALLAELCATVPLVFFSTDLVFDGRAGQYDESATVNPLSVYAETKVAAERIVLTNPLHLVIRTSLNSGPSLTKDRGFDEQICRAWQQGQTLSLFTDEFRSPIPAEVTARAVWELIERGACGVYHVAGAQRLSRWEIGQLLATRCPHLDARMQPASIREWTGAPRPPDTSLNSTKAQRRLSFPLPLWSDTLP